MSGVKTEHGLLRCTFPGTRRIALPISTGMAAYKVWQTFPTHESCTQHIVVDTCVVQAAWRYTHAHPDVSLYILHTTAGQRAPHPSDRGVEGGMQAQARGASASESRRWRADAVRAQTALRGRRACAVLDHRSLNAGPSVPGPQLVHDQPHAVGTADGASPIMVDSWLDAPRSSLDAPSRRSNRLVCQRSRSCGERSSLFLGLSS